MVAGKSLRIEHAYFSNFLLLKNMQAHSLKLLTIVMVEDRSNRLLTSCFLHLVVWLDLA